MLSAAIGFFINTEMSISISRIPIGTWAWFGVATMEASMIVLLSRWVLRSSSGVVKWGILCVLASSRLVRDWPTIVLRTVESSFKA